MSTKLTHLQAYFRPYGIYGFHTWFYVRIMFIMVMYMFIDVLRLRARHMGACAGFPESHAESVSVYLLNRKRRGII